MNYQHEETSAAVNLDNSHSVERTTQFSEDGVKGLRNDLLERGIDVDVCAKEVLAMVQDFIDFHTVGAKVEMAVTKIQTWWRKQMKHRIKDNWDNSNDPPNWGNSLSPNKTVSLETPSEDEWEFLYNEIEIETGRMKRERIQQLIEDLEGSDEVNEEVFESIYDDTEEKESVQSKKRGNRNDSTVVNVFAGKESRPNSEEVFITKFNSQRRLSLNPEEIRYDTRSASRKSGLTRVPIETTPLKDQHIRENSTSPGSK